MRIVAMNKRVTGTTTKAIEFARNNFFSPMLVAVFAVSLSAQISEVQAEEVKGQQICDKIKTCVFETLGDQAGSEQIKAMLMNQLDTQCAATFAGKQDEIKEAGLVDEANACADAMLAMSCNDLMTPNGARTTEACTEFEEAAEEAGLELK